MDELRERIARAIIGAAGTNGPGEGALLSARRQAGRVIKELNLRAETVHVEGEWGFGARDDVRITGYLTRLVADLQTLRTAAGHRNGFSAPPAPAPSRHE